MIPKKTLRFIMTKANIVKSPFCVYQIKVFQTERLPVPESFVELCVNRSLSFILVNNCKCYFSFYNTYSTKAKMSKVHQYSIVLVVNERNGFNILKRL